jgi:3-deoxy-7-phosphoheptulonate synthase
MSPGDVAEQGEAGARAEGPDDARPLCGPDVLRARLPLGAEAAVCVERARRDIRAALHGSDARLLVVVGPCSIHDRDAALEYAARLANLTERLGHRLIVVMRTYFEKPRTTVGWKGFLHDPHVDGSGDLAEGIRRARALAREILALGVPCATELLDPLVAPYLIDLLSWVAIGARTSESQIHRELASGLPMPVGFKNATSGDVKIAANAVAAARRSHSALGIDARGQIAARRTRGNGDAHIVLRGGAAGPNYFPESISHAGKLGRAMGLARPVIVDCSHDNSGQDHRQQATVCRAVAEQLADPEHPILGVQLESHLHPGRQGFEPGAALTHGVSITDACIGWEETEALLHVLARLTSHGA